MLLLFSRPNRASHLLSGQIPFEALELLVIHAYTDPSSHLGPPGSVTAGFLRFLHLLSSHDWSREPLIVDPQGHLSEDDHDTIVRKFEKARGPSYDQGPPMYIVSPSFRVRGNPDEGGSSSAESHENTWISVFTESCPELVVLMRAAALAERTHGFLRRSLTNFDADAWAAAFQESAVSFQSYSVLLRMDPAFTFDLDSSSTIDSRDLCPWKDNDVESVYTRSMRNLANGPKELRQKLYRNLVKEEDSSQVLLEWRPIRAAVHAVREKLGDMALFFYNDLCPEVIAIVWRPTLFQPRPFSAMNSEYVQPVVSDGWKPDTLVTLNVADILRESLHYTADLIIDTRIFDSGPEIGAPATTGSERKRVDAVRESSDSSDNESD
jgi:U3 small nucleolar RNA-associated protein 22